MEWRGGGRVCYDLGDHAKKSAFEGEVGGGVAQKKSKKWGVEPV